MRKKARPLKVQSLMMLPYHVSVATHDQFQALILSASHTTLQKSHGQANPCCSV